MKTKAAIVLSLITCVTLFASPCWAWLETLMIQEPNRTHVIKGYFKETGQGSAFPLETMFSYEIQSSTSSSHERYYFSRQTGDDSFEIRHTWAAFAGFRAGKPSEEILKVPFKPDGEYPLPLSLLTFQACGKQDLAVLKMINLKDNVIGFRIILPACLREAVKKDREMQP